MAQTAYFHEEVPKDFLLSFTPTLTWPHAYARSRCVCMGMGEREKEVINRLIPRGLVKEGSKSNAVFSGV